MSAVTTIYAVAAHRSWDNYYAKFMGFGTFAAVKAAFRTVTPELVALTHGSTMTVRRDYIDHRTPDEFVILRYDVPADADQLHVQFIRWKYGGLTMTASHEAPLDYPQRMDALNDCVYEAVWFRPVTTNSDPSTPSSPSSPVVTV